MTLNFPNSPADGDIHEGYQYDATKGVWTSFKTGSQGPYILGLITPWVGATEPTWGKFLNGQTIVGGATTYSGIAALFPAWVSGSNLVLPDWGTRTPVGFKAGDDTFFTLGAMLGAKKHTLTVAEMPSHNHGMQQAFSYAPGGNSATNGFSGAISYNTSNTGGDQPHNNVQPSVVVNWVVCVATSSGQFDTEVQAALVAKIDERPLSENYILNSNFEIWQRGTTVAQTSTMVYSADRWESLRSGFATGQTCSRQGTSLLPGVRYGLRAQRNFGNASTASLSVGQPMESAVSRTLAGKTVTLSFYVRVGANYSAASGLFSVSLITGTGTDQNGRAGFTGQASAISQAVPTTTSWVRHSFTATLATTVNQLNASFGYTPVGTAGGNDWFEITGVQLEVGPLATAYRPQFANPGAELAACQRFYEKSYDLDTPPGTATGVGAVEQYGVSDLANNAVCRIDYKVTKRAIGTLSSWNRSGASGTWTYSRSGIGETATATVNTYRQGTQGGHIYGGVGAAWAPCFFNGHWVCDAEL